MPIPEKIVPVNVLTILSVLLNSCGMIAVPGSL
jgi:hypothetical protein